MVPIEFLDFLGKKLLEKAWWEIRTWKYAVKFAFTQPRVFLKKILKSSSIQLPVKFLPFYLTFLWITLHTAKKTKY